MHKNCRREYYDVAKTIRRFKVPDDKVSWDVDMQPYNPTAYTDNTKAELQDPNFWVMKSGKHEVMFNANEKKGYNRLSHEGPYRIVDGVPQNPHGRTGVKERGKLWRWGPNHAADPVVTRWARKPAPPKKEGDEEEAGDDADKKDDSGDDKKADDNEEDEKEALPAPAKKEDPKKEPAPAKKDEKADGAKKEDAAKKEEEKEEKVQLPKWLCGVWKAKNGDTQTVIISKRLRDAADPPDFAAYNNKRAAFWAHMWVKEGTKITLKDMDGGEYTAEMKINEELNKIQLLWSDDDVWTCEELEFDLDNEENANKKPGEILTRKGKPVLECVIIQRKDGEGWALPGGMINKGELHSVTCQREFGEEAMNFLDKKEEEKEAIKKEVKGFFTEKGHVVYKGYVDDPRNTDMAWMETTAVHFHDDTGDIVKAFPLEAGDDAAHVEWRALDKDRKLYACHESFLKQCAERVDAYW